MSKDPNAYAPKVAPSPDRERLRRRSGRALARELVTVDVGDDDGPRTYEVRELATGARLDLVDGSQAPATDDAAADAKTRIRLAVYTPRLIALSTYVPGTDERVWNADDPADIAAINDEPTSLTDPLSDVAAQLSKLNKGAADAAKNGSGGSATADSSTI